MTDMTLTGGMPPGNVVTGTQPLKFTGTLTWASETEAKSLDFNLAKQTQDTLDHAVFLLGDFWLKVEQTSDAPEAEDDIDIAYRPLAIDADGDLSTTQQAAEDIKNAAAFDSKLLHMYFLNNWVLLDIEQGLGGDGGRFTFTPAVEMCAELEVELIIR